MFKHIDLTHSYIIQLECLLSRVAYTTPAKLTPIREYLKKEGKTVLIIEDFLKYFLV